MGILQIYKEKLAVNQMHIRDLGAYEAWSSALNVLPSSIIKIARAFLGIKKNSFLGRLLNVLIFPFNLAGAIIGISLKLPSFLGMMIDKLVGLAFPEFPNLTYHLAKKLHVISSSPAEHLYGPVGFTIGIIPELFIRLTNPMLAVFSSSVFAAASILTLGIKKMYDFLYCRETSEPVLENISDVPNPSSTHSSTASMLNFMPEQSTIESYRNELYNDEVVDDGFNQYSLYSVSNEQDDQEHSNHSTNDSIVSEAYTRLVV